MTNIRKTRSLAIASLFVASSFYLGTSAPAQADPVPEHSSVSVPSAVHGQDVTFLREEEKLARDVYITLYNKWKLPIFDNISKAEQRHMDRMGSLLESYKLPDPIKNDKVGVFKNKKLATLYRKLVARASKSEVSALQVGATIEDLDLRDILAMKARTTNTKALEAFEVLECGSRNHLRAFTRQLKAKGASYKPQYLSSAQVDAIITGNHERCGQASAKGQGARQGRQQWYRGAQGKDGKDGLCGQGGEVGNGGGGQGKGGHGKGAGGHGKGGRGHGHGGQR